MTDPVRNGFFCPESCATPIRISLLGLDEEKRIAFTLKVLEQKSYEEIAATTGSAIAKLKTDVHRARLQLRVALAKYREEDRCSHAAGAHRTDARLESRASRRSRKAHRRRPAGQRYRAPNARRISNAGLWR